MNDDISLDRSALLVIDMQNGFCHPEGTMGVSGVDVRPFREVIEPIRNLVHRFSDNGLPVLWTRQQNFEQDRTREAKQLPHHTAKRKRVVGLAGTWDAEIIEELSPLVTRPELLITKHRFGGFFETRLHLVLRMLGVQTLVVTGVAANTCVETTIREAYMRDYDIIAVTDCIGAIKPDWGRMAVDVWNQYFCVLATSSEIAKLLSPTGAAGADSA